MRNLGRQNGEPNRGRSPLRAALCALCVAWPLALDAQARLVCSTQLGWCEVPEASETASLCWCRSGDRQIPGSHVRAQSTNPLTRLDAASDAPMRSLPGATLASRSFAGPSQMPPSDFRAYGVVVFKTRASSFDEERHLFICEAYANSLAHADEIGAPESQQMVTIWPVTKDDIADEINELPSTQACRAAVDNYGLVHALNALEILESYEAADGPYDTRGRGPFLVAWTPAASIAEPESVALLVDLSDVDRPEQAVEMMTLWRDRIQDNPQLWQDGVAKETFIDALRRFFDRNGALLEAVGSL